MPGSTPVCVWSHRNLCTWSCGWTVQQTPHFSVNSHLRIEVVKTAWPKACTEKILFQHLQSPRSAKIFKERSFAENISPQVWVWRRETDFVCDATTLPSTWISNVTISPTKCCVWSHWLLRKVPDNWVHCRTVGQLYFFLENDMLRCGLHHILLFCFPREMTSLKLSHLSCLPGAKRTRFCWLKLTKEEPSHQKTKRKKKFSCKTGRVENRKGRE